MPVSLGVYIPEERPYTPRNTDGRSVRDSMVVLKEKIIHPCQIPGHHWDECRPPYKIKE